MASNKVVSEQPGLLKFRDGGAVVKVARQGGKTRPQCPPETLGSTGAMSRWPTPKPRDNRMPDERREDVSGRKGRFRAVSSTRQSEKRGFRMQSPTLTET